MLKRLDPNVLVAGQILPDQVPGLAAEGVTTIVNNRPDGEEPGQPSAADIAAAARQAGLEYRHIPVAGGLSPAQVEEAADILDSAPGKVLMFCRSGTRSTFLWAFARGSLGADPDEIAAQAAGAGYDLSPILPHLRR